MNHLEIIDFDHLGRGIAKLDGKVIFIPNTIPGEIISFHIVKEHKTFLLGEVSSFIKKSGERVENLCPHYPDCGGCQLLHLPYKDQLLYKEKKVENIFQKTGLGEVKIAPIVFSEKQFNYRNKATFHIENKKIGFFQEKTNTVIPIEKCLLLDPVINAKLKDIPLTRHEVSIRSNGNDIVYNDTDELLYVIGNLKFHVSLASFFQVNSVVTPLLYEKVLAYLEPNRNDTVIDLYCGTGTIGIFVSSHVKKVIGIEINKQAIKNAKRNKETNGINNIDFLCGDAATMTKKLTCANAVIVDPPRSGLDHATVNILLDLAPERIIYVSCEPMTLARDLKYLAEKYDIIEITPFDMFPNTYHVECVVKLEKKEQA